MVYVTDKKATSANKCVDFKFNTVSADKKALWHSKEDAYYSISCFVRDNHAGDTSYSVSRYEITDEK